MSDSRARVRLRLLGPFACTCDGEPVAVSGRLRSVLAVLAMSAGEPVTFARLIDGVWGDKPPAEPRRALQVYVNRLRGVLGTDTITTQPSGYSLEVAAEDVDALRFGRLAAEALDRGEAGDRRELVDSALEVWAGEPFEAVTSAPLHEVEAPRLLERWLAMVEERFDLRLRAAVDTERVEPLIAELDGLTRRYPLREPLWERLLTALSLAGRSAEALERYEEIRTHLAEELGTVPGQGLQTLYARLLDYDGAVVARIPQQLPPDLPQFAGREAILERLDEILLETGDDAPAVAAITGTGGAGKTTLATHWAHRHRDRFPDGQLHVDLHGFSSQAPRDPSGALEVLLRGLGVAAESVPAELAERSALLRTELSGRKALLVLDNARDADQVRPLLPGSSSRAIVTSRNQLRGLTARDGARPVALEPFDEAEALSLLRSTLGSSRVADDTGAVREIADLCGRLPLAVAITAERAARIPSMPLAEVATELRDERRRLENLSAGDDERSDLRAVFDLSYRILEPESARLFRLLSLLPDGSFDAAYVAALAGMSARRIAAILDGLVGGHLVQQPGFGRYSLHDLIRAYAAERRGEEDGAESADAAVARATEWLLRGLGSATSVVRPGQPAIPIPSFGGRASDVAGPGPIAFDSFAEVSGWFQHERPMLIGWVHRAAERGLHDHVWRLVSPLSLLMTITEYREAAVSLAELATTSVDRLDDPAARYVAYDCAGRAFMRMFRLEDAEEALSIALAAAREAGHHQAEAAILCDAGIVRRLAGDMEAALRLQKQALGLVGRPDASLLEGSTASILTNIGACYYDLRDLDAAAVATRQGLEGARATGDVGRQVNSLSNLTLILGEAGDHLAADEAFVELERLSEEMQAPAQLADTLAYRGRMLAGRGDREAAIEIWERALSLLPATAGPQRTAVLALLDEARA